MSVQITIRNREDPSYYIEQEFFNQDKINIGSDDSNQIVLDDQHNHISSHHVQIIIDGKNYYLIDKGSQFGTYIRGNKVAPNEPIPIDAALEFTLGEFQVLLNISGASNQYEDESIFIGNPFNEEIHALDSLFNRLYDRYKLENETRKELFLKHAFREMLDENEENEVYSIFLQAMMIRNKNTSQSLPAPSGVLLDLLLETMEMLLKTYTRFKEEFLQEPLDSTQSGSFFKSMAEVKEFFLNPEATQEDTQQKTVELYQELATIIKHQMALLDGYRYGVQEGSVSLLREIDPAEMKKNVEQSTSLGVMSGLKYKFLPSLLKSKTLRLMQQKYADLSEKGKSFIEKKFFRPPFMEKYQESFRLAEHSEELLSMKWEDINAERLSE